MQRWFEIVAGVSAIALGALLGYLTHEITPSVSRVWHFAFGVLVSISLIVLHYATGLRSLLFGLSIDAEQLRHLRLRNASLERSEEESERRIQQPTTEQIERLVFDKGWPFYARFRTSEPHPITPQKKSE
jgi:hypothetical protein